MTDCQFLEQLLILYPIFTLVKYRYWRFSEDYFQQLFMVVFQYCNQFLNSMSINQLS